MAVPLRVAAVALLAGVCVAENWPTWRGAEGIGVSREKDPPARWSRTENVKWRVALPEPANSTPVVWGDRVFVTQPIKAQSLRALLCFDRNTGKQLWQASVKYEELEPTHATNPYASASPVTDGERVYAWFGSAGVVAYDFNGREQWRRDLGRQRHTWGYGSSPILAGDRLILSFGPGDRAFLVALDKKTGKQLWQVDVPQGEGAKFANWDAKDMYGSWSTPIVARVGSRDELIVSLPHRVVAYDPATGKQLWTCDGMGDLVYASPVIGSTSSGEQVVVAMGGFGQASLAVKPGGSRLWQFPKSRQMIGSGVIAGGNFYYVDTGGVAECLDLATGKSVWTGRLRGAGDDNGVWSSLVLNQDKLYVMNKSGDTFIFKAGPAFELLGTNPIGESTNSSVVISGGDIFLRTHQALWRIRAAGL